MNTNDLNNSKKSNKHVIDIDTEGAYMHSEEGAAPYAPGAQPGAQLQHASLNAPLIEYDYYRTSCVFYENWFKTIEMLPEEEQLKTLKMIFRYSFYKIMPKNDNSESYRLFHMTIPNIEKSKERYEKSCDVGKTCGKTKHENYNEIIDLYFNQGWKQKAIADYLNISINTVKSIIARHKQKRVQGAKGAKLNDNVNATVNETVNVNVNAPAPGGASAYASLTTTAAPATSATAETKVGVELNPEQNQSPYTFDDKITVMKLFKQHIKPSDIAKITGFTKHFIHEAINEFRNNNDTFPKPPIDKNNTLFCTDGKPFMNKTEFFNDCTNNGTILYKDISWQSINECLIQNKVTEPDKVISEMKQKLLHIQSMSDIVLDTQYTA